MKEKSNFKYFLDWLGNHWEIPLIIILLVFGLLGVGPCASKAKAECITYTTVKKDTLGKLAKRFYGDRNYWHDIKWQNNLKRNTLPIGIKLHMYMPGHSDWETACRNIILQRIETKRIDPNRYIFIQESTLEGIRLATDILDFDPRQRLEACRLATATAEQESMYEFAVGGAGEVGPYQFKLNTVRMTLRPYESSDTKNNDEELVRLLLDYSVATQIFILHYYDLLGRCKGSRWCAWKRYNNGSEAAAYASKAMKRYWEIRSLQPGICKL
jgi:hypothetical protein